MSDVIKNLPLSVQLLILGSTVLIGLLWALNKFWTVRYFNSQDERMRQQDAKVSQAMSQAQEVMSSLKDIGVRVKTELLDFRKETFVAHEDFRKECHIIKGDLSQITLRVHVIKDHLDAIDKKAMLINDTLKRDRDHVNGIDKKLEKVTVTQEKMITVIEKISDRVFKISQK